MTKKILIVIVIAVVLPLAYFYFQFQPSPNPQFGLSFSTSHAQYLGFDWKEMYLDMLNDLRPKKLRLMAYWELIEPKQGQFDFQTMDEMVIEAGKRDIDVILAIGRKLPRWQECHQPAWYAGLTEEQQRQGQLTMIEQVVSHFRQFDAIKIWQVENEPLFEFGKACPKIEAGLVREEIAIIKKSDSRPVLLSDSGEQGNWAQTVRLGADIFGSTMYRTVYSERWGYYKYPLPAWFFRIKAGWLRKFTGIEKVIGVELQAEPWFVKEIFQTELTDQFALMNPKIFEANVNYAKKAGFEENYLWGVEWWYWLAKEKNDWGMWNQAKQLLAE